MKSQASALAVALALVRGRVGRMLAIDNYADAMNRVVDLDILLREMQDAERSAQEGM